MRSGLALAVIGFAAGAGCGAKLEQRSQPTRQSQLTEATAVPGPIEVAETSTNESTVTNLGNGPTLTLDRPNAAPTRPQTVSVPQPAIDFARLLPDLRKELRWPLSPMSHPELEPQFAIANVFAQPGIGWIELCERGAQHRVSSGRYRDELEYLRGWCHALKGDADGACGKLAPLLRSSVTGMAAAVRVDLANIIANAGEVDVADKLLHRHRIHDPQLFDRLAATYFDLGKERDAYEINRRVVDTAAKVEAADHCHRLVKDLVLSGPTGGRMPLAKLAQMATGPKVPDQTCVRLHNAAKCWNAPPGDCEDHFRAEGINPTVKFAFEAYRRWPTAETFDDWAEVASIASLATETPEGVKLAMPAVYAALRVAPSCSLSLLRTMARLRGASATPQDFKSRTKTELDLCGWVHDCTDRDKRAVCQRQACGENLDASECIQETTTVSATCDAVALKDKGLININMGQHAAALAQFEASLRCKLDPYVLTLAFMEACASQNSPKAKHYYKRLTAPQQAKFKQICVRQKPPVAYQ